MGILTDGLADDIFDFKIPYSGLLTEEQVIQIRDNSNQVRYNKRDVIFLQNTRTSHIMLVKSGMVKIYKEGKNSKVIILKLETPGNYLGLMSIFGQDIHQYSASAIEPTEIFFIDRSTFTNILEENGRYALKLINLISENGLFIFEKLLAQSHKQLPGRIADLILYFSDVFNGEEFEFPFTRRELAELAGTTKESLIRTLTEFKNDKIIDLDGSKVEIKSMKIVKTLSDLG
ncbi:MAG TPA: Crp/Fnr family transcriptional regulator [Bacteroidales bacterium]|nr:Crp/Fnr family transcriptional regulator [Bacteroidales bacterium]